MADFGTGAVTIEPDVRGFATKLSSGIKPALSRVESGLSRTTHSAGRFLSGFARVASRAFLAAGAAAVVLGKQAIDAFAESQAVGAQSAAVIKSTGGAANVTKKQVQDLAQSIRDYSGISDEAVQAGENMLLTFTNIRNEQGKNNDIFNQATAILADMSTALGTDMPTSAIQLGKALNDPVKGITALRRVGVAFTDEQQKQIETLVKNGQTMQAQKLILAELTKEFGGSAKAMGKTAKGQLNIVKEQFGDVLEQVGKKFLPVLSTVAGKLLPVFKRLAGPLADFAGVLGQTLANLLPAITPLLDSVVKVLGQLLSALAPVITALGKALAPIFTALAPIVGQLGRALADILLALVPLVPPLGDLLVALAPLLVLVARLAGALVKLLVPALKVIIGILAVVVNAVVQFLVHWRGAWEKVKAIGIAVWNAISGFFKRWWPVLAAMATGGLSLIVGFFITHWNKIKDFLVGVWQHLKDIARTAWNAVKDAILTVIHAVTAPIQALIDLIHTLMDALKSLASSVLHADVSGGDWGKILNPGGDGGGGRGHQPVGAAPLSPTLSPAASKGFGATPTLVIDWRHNTGELTEQQDFDALMAGV